MKKITLTLLALVCALCCAFGLVACDDGQHECKFTAYGYAGTEHWAYCSVEGCREELPRENHKFIDSVCVCGATVLAYYASENGETAFVGGLHYGVYEGLNALKNIVVAAEYEGKPVTELKSYAFANCEEIESVTLPVTITKIADYILANSSKLTKITYNGTIAQWNAISKNNEWDSEAGGYTVHCTDGDLVKTAQ